MRKSARLAAAASPCRGPKRYDIDSALVAAGELTSAQANALFDAGPFQSKQRESRSGKFWMTLHPIAVDDGGVEPLLGHWGRGVD